MRDELSERIARMSCTLAHRGPDDAGTWVDAEAGLALGFRRLSIIDLSPAGHQPMISSGGDIVVTFNGEIYNHRDLRAELEATGVVFRGRSDTEVVAESIQRWGFTAAVPRWSGMFAVAAWDRAERVLWLARDRFGKKPLYYRLAGPRVAFGSELKALRADPASTFRIDPAAVAAYFGRAYVPAPLSIYEGVLKLPAGYYGCVGEEGAIRLVRYWSPVEVFARGHESGRDVDDEEAVQRTASLIENAVKRRLEADVPLGVFLSGGIDSTVVTATMCRVASGKVRSFSIGFRDAAYDEAPFAREVARHLGTEHIEHYVAPGEALDVIPRLPDIYDEPFADSSQIPTFLVCQAARRHVTVALSGDGGDEVFGGYNRYVWAEDVWRMGRRLGALGRTLVRGSAWLGPHRIDASYRLVVPFLPRALRMRLPAEKLEKAMRVMAAGDEQEVHDRLVSCWDPGVSALNREFAAAAQGTHADAVATAGTLTERLMLADVRHYLPDDILVKVDRASMAVSLEIRSPLLDPELLEWTTSLPMRLRAGAREGKILLRRLAARFVPAVLLDRPKSGFGVPIDSWLRGPLREWAESLLAPPILEDGGILDVAAVRRAWGDHLSGKRLRHHQIWAVLMFQAWRRRWGM